MTSALQKQFYELSRQFHPGPLQPEAPAEEQDYALEATAILNDGYRILRDPVKRAEYLLKQEGFDIGEQRSKDVPPELLEEVFELNMVLEELRGGDESRGRSSNRHARSFSGCERDTDQRTGDRLFAKYDAAPERPASVLHEIRGVLNRRRYIENLVRDVERAVGLTASS